jgi:hypothetical protein
MNINWTKIHEATETAAQADYDAFGSNLAGWGGTGAFARRPETPMGLAQLWSVCQNRLHAAWKAIHGAKPPRQEADSDYGPRWEVERPDGTIDTYDTRRGARWSASVNGGQARLAFNLIKQQRRIKAAHDQYRALLHWAIAMGELHDVLVEALGEKPRQSVICTVRDGVLHVAGVRWYLGATRDPGGVPIEAVNAFIAGGSIDELRQALSVETA